MCEVLINLYLEVIYTKALTYVVLLMYRNINVVRLMKK